MPTMSANDVASVIIARSGPWIDAMSLQKLLYYVQAWHLAITDEPLFSDEIEAWKNGPVVRNVRNARREKPTRAASRQDLTGIYLDEQTSSLIDLVLSRYGSMSADELSALTHVEQPWIEARGGLPSEAACSVAIGQNSMASFYRENRRLGGRTAADLAVGGVHLRDPDSRDHPPIDVDAILASIGSEFDEPGEDPWGGANLEAG